MTRSSTALLTVSPKHVGSWNDTHLWRLSGSAQLVEGSTPYWLVTPTLPAQHPVEQDSVTIEQPDKEFVLDSALMVLGAWFGGDRVADYLVETHNLEVRSEVRTIAPYWDFSESTREFIAAEMNQYVRLGVTVLDDLSLVSSEVISGLRSLGFDVTVFVEDSRPR